MSGAAAVGGADAGGVLPVVFRAAVLCDLDRPRQALALIAPMVGRAPGSVEVLVVLARALLMTGDASGALTAAGSAGALDPDNPLPCMLTGNALAALGRHQEAAEAAERAVRLEPDHAEWHLALAAAFLGAGQPDAALTAARTATRLAPQEPDCHIAVGAALDELGRHEHAGECYRRALRLDPGNALAHHQLAESTVHVRGLAPTAFAAAATGFATALASDPTQQESRLALDTVLSESLSRVPLLIALAGAIAAELIRLHLQVVGRLTASAGLAVPAAYTVLFLTRLPRRIRPHLRALATTHRNPVALTAAAAILLLTAAPLPSSWAYPTLLAAATAGILARVRITAANNQRLRENGIPVPYALGPLKLAIIAAVLTAAGLTAAITTATGHGKPSTAIVAVACLSAAAYTIHTIHSRHR